MPRIRPESKTLRVKAYAIIAYYGMPRYVPKDRARYTTAWPSFRARYLRASVPTVLRPEMMDPICLVYRTMHTVLLFQGELLYEISPFSSVSHCASIIFQLPGGVKKAKLPIVMHTKA